MASEQSGCRPDLLSSVLCQAALCRMQTLRAGVQSLHYGQKGFFQHQDQSGAASFKCTFAGVAQRHALPSCAICCTGIASFCTVAMLQCQRVILWHNWHVQGQLGVALHSRSRSQPEIGLVSKLQQVPFLEMCLSTPQFFFVRQRTVSALV